MVRPLRLSGRVRVSPWKRAPQTPSVILAGVHPERGAEGEAWSGTERGGGEIKQSPVLVAVKGLVEQCDQFRVAVLFLQDAAENDEASGAPLAFSSREAGLSAADLAFEVIALASLGILQLVFASLELLRQGFLAGQ